MQSACLTCSAEVPIEPCLVDDCDAENVLGFLTMPLVAPMGLDIMTSGEQTRKVLLLSWTSWRVLIALFLTNCFTLGWCLMAVDLVCWLRVIWAKVADNYYATLVPY